MEIRQTVYSLKLGYGQMDRQADGRMEEVSTWWIHFLLREGSLITQRVNNSPTNQNVCKRTWTFVSSMKAIFFSRNSPPWARASSLSRFIDHTQRRTTVGRTPLDEWSARCRDLYLTTHYTHNRQTSMLPVGFEPTISVGELPQTYALDRAATATGNATYLAGT